MPRITEVDRERILDCLRAEPDLTQERWPADSKRSGVRSASKASAGACAVSASRTKTMRPEQQLTEAVQAERAAFLTQIATIDPGRIEAVDESCNASDVEHKQVHAEIGLRLGHGYSPRGEAAMALRPTGRFVRRA